MVLFEESLSLEKRRYPRFNVNLPVKYSRTNLIFRYGRAINASQGGLLVHLPEEIGIGQRLGVKIFFPSHAEFNALETSVQVVWKDVHMRKDWTWDYRTGVRFVNVSPEHMNDLKKFLVNVAPKLPPTA
jgi:hypothetical protein